MTPSYKKLASGVRKHVRLEKARIRREFFDTDEQKRLINELYIKVKRGGAAHNQDKNEKKSKPREKAPKKAVSSTQKEKASSKNKKTEAASQKTNTVKKKAVSKAKKPAKKAKK